MARALAESQRALPLCLPNPPVGCVVASGSLIRATGYTRAPGQHHAEAMALAALPPNPAPFSVYVTLEPCSFYGRTPSCALALTQFPVDTVYVGMLDPDPRNNGKGLDILRQAGIRVEVGLLAEDVAAFLQPYLWTAAR